MCPPNTLVVPRSSDTDCTFTQHHVPTTEGARGQFGAGASPHPPEHPPDHPQTTQAHLCLPSGW